ncbi:MAG: helix-turn-helix transcriptional regulator, partial [Bacteroidales bacterium]|nr:helix-turn-helix transcriptional regulator [Bacteroidales bacterium]
SNRSHNITGTTSRSKRNGILDKRKIIWDSFSKRPYAPLRSTVQGKGDEQFLQQISEIVSVRFTDMDFSVDDLAEQMHLSRSVLFERTKEACGMTPNNFIKEMRLRKAASLLAEQKYKVNEICYMVGFNTPSYFAKCFFRQFGVLPKDFVG